MIEDIRGRKDDFRQKNGGTPSNKQNDVLVPGNIMKNKVAELY